MIGVVYLGSNPKTEERLRYIPGRLVQYTRNYKDAASACSTHVRNEHFIVFYEQNDPNEDINAITYLKKKKQIRLYYSIDQGVDARDTRNLSEERYQRHPRRQCLYYRIQQEDSVYFRS